MSAKLAPVTGDASRFGKSKARRVKKKPKGKQEVTITVPEEIQKVLDGLEEVQNLVATPDPSRPADGDVAFKRLQERVAGANRAAIEDIHRDYHEGHISRDERDTRIARVNRYGAVDEFLFAGVTYRGRCNFAYEASGVAVEVTAAAKIPGLLNFEVEGKLSSETLHQRCLLTWRGPYRAAGTSVIAFKNQRYVFYNPVTVLSLVGEVYKFTADVKGSVSLGFSGSLGMMASGQPTAKISGVPGEANIDTTTREPKDPSEGDGDAKQTKKDGETSQEEGEAPNGDVQKKADGDAESKEDDEEEVEITDLTGISDKIEEMAALALRAPETIADLRATYQAAKKAFNEEFESAAMDTDELMRTPGKKAGAMLESGAKKLEARLDKLLAEYEVATVSLEAKASASLSLGVEYQTFAAYDPNPRCFSDEETSGALRDHISDLLRVGSTEEILMEEAGKITAHHLGCCFDEAFEPTFYTAWQEFVGVSEGEPKQGRQRPGVFLGWLELRLGEKARHMCPEVRKWARTTYARMREARREDSEVATFLRVSTLAGTAEAKAYAGIGASAQVAVPKVLSASMESGVSGALIANGGYKSSSGRLQVESLARIDSKGPDDWRRVYTTYDTMVTYSQFKLEPSIHLKTAAKGEAFGKQVQKGAVEKVSETWFPDTLNRVRYKTSIAVWDAPPEEAFKSRNLLGTQKTAIARLLPTSGVAYGESANVHNLRNLYLRNCKRGRKPATFRFDLKTAVENPLVVAFAESLKVTCQQLVSFFNDAEVYDAIQSFRETDSGSLFLESTFRARPKYIVVERRSDFSDNTLQPEDEVAGQLFKSADEAKELEAIRLRYRRRDHVRTSTDLFSPGFKFLGAGVKINLSEVEHAGSDALVELATTFFHVDFKQPDLSVAALYERAVPTAILLGL